MATWLAMISHGFIMTKNDFDRDTEIKRTASGSNTTTVIPVKFKCGFCLW